MFENKTAEQVRNLLNTKQYTTLRQSLSDMNTADAASLLGSLTPAERLKIFRLLSKAVAAAVFSYLKTEDQQYIILSLTDREAGNLINKLMTDDAVDFLEEMPASVVTRILANTSAETRRDINHLLQYPDESAGSIMTVEFVDLKETMTVAEAVARIRRIGVDKETSYICYVVDDNRTLTGAVSLHHLLMSPDDVSIHEIMDDNVIYVHTLADQEAVAKQFAKYDFIAMPVVDNEKRLVGIITADDVMDIINEEASEDIAKMAALSPTEQPYLETGITVHVKNRIFWLLFLMLSASVTSMIIAGFEESLSALPILMAFVPMLMDTGGNSGAQTSALMIRGIALGEIEFRHLPRILWREFNVALLCGSALAIVNFIRIYFMNGRNILLCFTVSLALVATVIIAKLVGATLPLLARKLKIDPALLSAPVITTIADASSLAAYFALASLVFRI